MTLSRDCEDLAKDVPDPYVGLDTDPKFAVGAYAVALGEANGNLTATKTCQQHQRERLSKGK